MEERNRKKKFLNKVFSNSTPLTGLTLIATYPILNKEELAEQLTKNYTESLIKMSRDSTCSKCDSTEIVFVDYPSFTLFCGDHLPAELPEAPFMPLCHKCKKPAQYFSEDSNTYQLLHITPTDETHPPEDKYDTFFNVTNTELFLCKDHASDRSHSFEHINSYIVNLHSTLKAMDRICQDGTMNYVAIKRIEDIYDIMAEGSRIKTAAALLVADAETPNAANFGAYINKQLSYCGHDHDMRSSDYYKKQISILTTKDLDPCPEDIKEELLTQAKEMVADKERLQDSLLPAYNMFTVTYNYEASVNDNITKKATEMIEKDALSVYEKLYIMSFFLKNWFFFPREKAYSISEEYRKHIFDVTDKKIRQD